MENCSVERTITYKPARGTCVIGELTSGVESHRLTNNSYQTVKCSDMVQPRKEELYCSLSGWEAPDLGVSLIAKDG